MPLWNGGFSEDLTRQLRDVFELCDTNKSGYISLEHLVSLGKAHFGDKNEGVEDVLQQLDTTGRGVIGFEDFCRGVATILQTHTQGVAAREQHAVADEDLEVAQISEPNGYDSLVGTPPISSSTPHKTANHIIPCYLSPSSHSLPSDMMTTNGDTGFLLAANEEHRGSPHSLLTDVDSALGGSASPDINGKSNNSQCSSMSDGENFECYGQGVDLEFDTDQNGLRSIGDDSGTGSRSPNQSNFLRRNTWLRTSLRRTTPSNQDALPARRWGSFRHPGKRLGSNALASQLYRSSSFNSSGRSSNCDGDDMYSDVSLEEDVLDLNHKVQLLQQQVSALADNQTNTDDRYTRAKQENAALQARVHMLEEQLREVELRSDERLQEEQRRHRELIIRVEREKQLELENCSFRLQALEKEGLALQEESARLRLQVERLRQEKHQVEEQLAEVESTLFSLQEEHHKMQELGRREKDEISQERNVNTQIVEELSQEVERLRGEKGANRARSPSSLELPSRLGELQTELRDLREENKNLKETNEELQAQILNRSLEEGRNLLTGMGNNSLAAEFEAMTHDELKDNAEDQKSIVKVRGALKEQKEVNAQLRAYIDGILLNIVENYPQLLEVKRKK